MQAALQAKYRLARPAASVLQLAGALLLLESPRRLQNSVAPERLGGGGTGYHF